MKNKRVIWIVLDSVGIGAMPDADRFGDTGADTLGHIAEAYPDIRIPNLRSLGLGCIEGAAQAIGRVPKPIGVYGKAAEVSDGKDSVTGHWEMIGIRTKEPFQTFPDGFPDRIVNAFTEAAGIPGVLGNCVDSGTAIIQRLGREHEETGKPILYTSQDSVFQIAASEETFGLDRLYRTCEIARAQLTGKDLMARVIARPFIRNPEGEGYVRTSNRHDYAIHPGEENLLAYLGEAGVPVISVGKINDLFSGCGIRTAYKTKNNEDGVSRMLEVMQTEKEGLIFTNLVEFDSTWGHRRDVPGYKAGLEAFDRHLPEILDRMEDEDLLIITADHGCDPSYSGTDHTREYVPVLLYGKQLSARNIGIRTTFADMGETVGQLLGVKHLPVGTAIQL